MRRLVSAAVREPLFHFVLAGAALFAIVAFSTGASRAEVRIGAGDVAQLVAYWEAQAQRKPTAAELQQLIDERIDEEILAREALQLGLDRDDVIIRRRLAQKMAFIREDLTEATEPDEAALRSYFETHRADYTAPPVYAVRQIFFSVDSRGANIERDAKAALQRLARGADAGAHADTMSDPSMLPNQFADVARADIERDFGSAFAAAVVAAPTGVWQGPVRSSFGLHLLRVESAVPAHDASFEEARDRVKDAYRAERRREANAALRSELRKKYRIVVDSNAPTNPS